MKWFPIASSICVLTVSFMAFQNFSFTLTDDSALFFQSEDDGRIGYWSMDGNAMKQAGILTDKAALSDWRLASVIDMNGDGYQDLIFQHKADGKLMYWLMHGTTRLSEHFLNESPDHQQLLVAVADLNRDGIMDFVFQNSASGQVSYWFMNSAGVALRGLLPNATGAILSDSRLALVTDINGDGYADFVWQQRSTGAVQFWLMQGLKTLASGDVNAEAMPDAILSASADFNKDGKTDFVFLKSRDHSAVLWLMDGIDRTASTFVNNSPASVGSEWRLVAGVGK